MRKLPIGLVVLALMCVACDFRFDLNGNPATPAASPTGPTVTVTNTNTNTSTSDRSDTVPPASSSSGTGGTGDTTTPLPLPDYGESVTRATATANPGLLANSCQDVNGDRAWEFLDLVISTLRARDQRWGYLCKDASCSTFGRDVITYRATAADTGIWIVDVIGNQCPGPTDKPAEVRWGVLPFETLRRWSATRK